MKAATETGLAERGTTPKVSKGSSKDQRPRPTRSPSKSESDEEDEGQEQRPRVSYYRKLMLPGGEVVDITKRNQFIREWKEKRLKCDPRPYYMLGAPTVLLLLMLYIYAYHQVGVKQVKHVRFDGWLYFIWRATFFTSDSLPLALLSWAQEICKTFIYNLFGRPGDNGSPQRVLGTPFDYTADGGSGRTPGEDAE